MSLNETRTAPSKKMLAAFRCLAKQRAFMPSFSIPCCSMLSPEPKAARQTLSEGLPRCFCLHSLALPCDGLRCHGVRCLAMKAQPTHRMDCGFAPLSKGCAGIPTCMTVAVLGRLRLIWNFARADFASAFLAIAGYSTQRVSCAYSLLRAVWPSELLHRPHPCARSPDSHPLHTGSPGTYVDREKSHR